jgi:16S rRNA (adenine1518-N6/adenine1519-N6)-dimethyltransferase
MPEQRITIVDENDGIIGAETRQLARRQGLRHRIVRVFLINGAGQILLQRRSLTLADSPGKWDQSAGGHVDEGESYEEAARRETKEELGIELTGLRKVGKMYIERQAQDGYIRRFQTIFVAHYEGPMRPDKAEVAELKWLSTKEIKDWHAAKPDDFTKNFITAFTMIAR